MGNSEWLLKCLRGEATFYCVWWKFLLCAYLLLVSCFYSKDWSGVSELLSSSFTFNSYSLARVFVQFSSSISFTNSRLFSSFGWFGIMCFFCCWIGVKQFFNCSLLNYLGLNLVPNFFSLCERIALSLIDSILSLFYSTVTLLAISLSFSKGSLSSPW